MKTIKIIDLLNKIANGEDVPKKIRYRNKIWEYTTTILGTGYQYYDNFFEEWKTLQHQVYLEEHLNDEVEIIEEDKKVKEIEQIYMVSGTFDEKIKVLGDKLNEIINAVNELKKEGK